MASVPLSFLRLFPVVMTTTKCRKRWFRCILPVVPLLDDSLVGSFYSTHHTHDKSCTV